MRLALCLSALLSMAALPAMACRLALLLALDVSSSVDPDEDRLQRDGLAAALADHRVQRAFLANGPVALAAYEWSGRRNQTPILGWQLIDTGADLGRAAARVRASQRVESEFPTALGYALGHAAVEFQRAPTCARQTLDVSGDGENNDGFAPHLAYRHFPFDGITVNALAIGGDPALIEYFNAEVVRGPGAFVEVAEDYTDFARAIRQKLLREVAPRAVGHLTK